MDGQGHAASSTRKLDIGTRLTRTTGPKTTCLSSSTFWPHTRPSARGGMRAFCHPFRASSSTGTLFIPGESATPPTSASKVRSWGTLDLEDRIRRRSPLSRRTRSSRKSGKSFQDTTLRSWRCGRSGSCSTLCPRRRAPLVPHRQAAERRSTSQCLATRTKTANPCYPRAQRQRAIWMGAIA